MTNKMDLVTWKGKVNELFLRRVCCSWQDLCGDIEPLEKAYAQGETPEEFVARYVRRFGLSTRE